MPGIPRSRGCTTCQKRKKKCDQIKPTCGLCIRLGAECVGNGAKRWKFMSYDGKGNTYNAAAARARRQPPPTIYIPSNEATSTAAALVHALEIQDVRFDIRVFGGRMLMEFPAQIGAYPELDASLAALVAIYSSKQLRVDKITALTKYGRALQATRRAIEKQATQPVQTMQTMLMVYACQAMIDRRHAERHRVMVARVFRDSVLTGTAAQIDPGYIRALCQIAAWVSLVDPTFKLGDWFWDVNRSCAKPRPVFYDPGRTFPSLENDSIAAAAQYLHAPEENLVQLRGIYKLVVVDKPIIRQLVMVATVAANQKPDSVKGRQLQLSLLLSWGTILGFQAIINRVLRGFDDDPDLVADACDCYNEALDMALQCDQFRPFGSGFLPEMLKAVWAGTSDLMGGVEIEELLADWENDVEGADHIGDAMYIKARLKRACQRRANSLDPEFYAGDAGDSVETWGMEAENQRCVVL